MSVTYMPNNNGGGLFSRLLPQMMGMAGTAIGGPIGGKLGQMGGNLIGGNSGQATGNALGIIGNLGSGTPQSAGNPIPDDEEIYNKWNNHFRGGSPWPSM